MVFCHSNRKLTSIELDLLSTGKTEKKNTKVSRLTPDFGHEQLLSSTVVGYDIRYDCVLKKSEGGYEFILSISGLEWLLAEIEPGSQRKKELALTYKFRVQYSMNDARLSQGNI